jgi:hypothetical protein
MNRVSFGSDYESDKNASDGSLIQYPSFLFSFPLCVVSLLYDASRSAALRYTACRCVFQLAPGLIFASLQAATDTGHREKV